MTNVLSLTTNRESWIPKSGPFELIEVKQLPALIILSEFKRTTGEVQYYAVAFRGKAQKPSFSYRFKSSEERAKYCHKWVEGQKKLFAEKIKNKEEAKKPHTLKVGDILYSSWGYDQTNIDFYIVTERVSDRSVRIAEIAQTTKDRDAWMQWDCMPNPEVIIGKEMLKRVSMYDGEPTISLTSYSCAWLWDGKPKHATGYA